MVEVFKALGDETRLGIVMLLSEGDKSAGELVAKFNMTGATVSHHLSVLRDSGLITDRHVGKYVVYSLNCSTLSRAVEYVRAINAVHGAVTESHVLPRATSVAPHRTAQRDH